MNKNRTLLLLLAVALTTLTSCDAIAGIFKAGIYMGIFLVILVVVIIIWLLRKLKG